MAQDLYWMAFNPRPERYRNSLGDLLSLLWKALAATVVIAPLVNAQSQAERIEAFLAKCHEDSLFNGSALIARDGKVIFEGGFGEADMSWHVPNTPATRFRIASTTKQFTASLILQLAEDGKIRLDAPVTDYLPDYPRPQGDRVKIDHLLSQTSGIPSYTSLPGFMTEAIRDPYEVDSLVALFSGLDLAFDPGTKWAYSNSNYILLGAIIEAVTGRPYDEVLRERILEPLGLSDTGYEHYEDVLDRQAVGYYRADGGYKRAPYLDTSVPYSAGMLYSTVEDLFRWDRSLYGNGPFKHPETKVRMFAPHASIPEALVEEAGLPPSYGYGWFVGGVAVAGDTVRVIEHGGTIFGFATAFMRMPDERNTIILLDNTMTGSIREIARGVRTILYGGSAPALKSQ